MNSADRLICFLIGVMLVLAFTLVLPLTIRVVIEMQNIQSKNDVPIQCLNESKGEE